MLTPGQYAVQVLQPDEARQPSTSLSCLKLGPPAGTFATVPLLVSVSITTVILHTTCMCNSRVSVGRCSRTVLKPDTDVSGSAVGGF